MSNVEYVRCAILDPYEHVLCYMDNRNEKSMHYENAVFKRYIKANAYTFEFSVCSKHENAVHLKEGNKVSFLFRNKGYYLTIRKVAWKKETIQCECIGLSLELVQEDAAALPFEEIEVEKYGKTVKEKQERNWKFEQYFYSSCAELANVRIGTNEISEVTKSLEFKSIEPILQRLFKIADEFEVELEFVTYLNNDYSLKEFIVNVYKDSGHGFGLDKTGTVIRYGQHEGLDRTGDITDLYTAIRAETTVSVYYPSYDDDNVLETSKDSETEIEYARLKSQDYKVTFNGFVDDCLDSRFTTDANNVRFPAQRDKFPSTLSGVASDRYLFKIEELKPKDIDDMEQRQYTPEQLGDLETYRNEYIHSVQKDIYLQCVKLLEEKAFPKVSYTLNGYLEGDLGDSFTIEDNRYNPVLYCQARIVEQEIRFDDLSKSKTTMDNFTEVSSSIKTDVLDYVQKLIDESKTYDVIVSAANGTVIKDSDTYRFDASVVSNGVDVTNDFGLCWTLDDSFITYGKTCIVNKEDVTGSSVLKIKAYDGNDVLRGEQSLTLIRVSDGQRGDDGASVQNVTIYYYISSSETSLAGGSWSTTYPMFQHGKYLFSRMRILMSDGNVILTDAVLEPGWQAAESVESLLSESIKLVSESTMTISETANAWTAEFNHLQKSVDGNTSGLETITKYIQMMDGQILLGVSGSDSVRLILKNDRIYFSRGSAISQTWIDDDSIGTKTFNGTKIKLGAWTIKVTQSGTLNIYKEG